VGLQRKEEGEKKQRGNIKKESRVINFSLLFFSSKFYLYEKLFAKEMEKRKKKGNFYAQN
jgi:hypothetical protein